MPRGPLCVADGELDIPLPIPLQIGRPDALPGRTVVEIPAVPPRAVHWVEARRAARPWRALVGHQAPDGVEAAACWPRAATVAVTTTRSAS